MMKILVVCSYNHGSISSFIREQLEWLNKAGFETDYFLITGKGITGYLKHLPRLIHQINLYKPDLVHAHYGLSALLASMQRLVPVIATFHGSDINIPWLRFLSKIAMKRSCWSVFVSQRLARLAGAKKNYSVISCGIDLNIFYPVNKLKARQKFGFFPEDKLILFSGAFDNKVKNYPLAKEAISRLNLTENMNSIIKPIELKGYSREQVNLLFSACDVALLTSFSEGSPNFIKEALACNCPIVATDVGDIRELVGDTDGCFIATFNTNDVAQKIKMALSFAYGHPSGTSGRERIIELELDADKANNKLREIYSRIIGKRHIAKPL
jgi:teichuronic acid biosynthesis glycosyltransferase TuaC